jgi:hypothetical protein
MTSGTGAPRLPRCPLPGSGQLPQRALLVQGHSQRNYGFFLIADPGRAAPRSRPSRRPRPPVGPASRRLCARSGPDFRGRGGGIRFRCKERSEEKGPSKRLVYALDKDPWGTPQKRARGDAIRIGLDFWTALPRLRAVEASSCLRTGHFDGQGSEEDPGRQAWPPVADCSSRSPGSLPGFGASGTS